MAGDMNARICVFISLAVFWVTSFIPFVINKDVLTTSTMVFSSVVFCGFLVWLCVFDAREIENRLNRLNNTNT